MQDLKVAATIVGVNWLLASYATPLVLKTLKVDEASEGVKVVAVLACGLASTYIGLKVAKY